MLKTEKINQIISESVAKCKKQFEQIDKIALHNQRKVLKAFQNNNVALRHFNGTTGYGYDDVGRDTLNRIFAEVFNTEDALVSPTILSGTHALTLALFGILRPNDVFLSVSGQPYDTLTDVISGKDNGSLADFGVKFHAVELLEDGSFNFEEIQKQIQLLNPKVVYIQKSRGYSWRSATSVKQIGQLVEFVRQFTNCCVMVDNCYGEFVETIEPTDVGADLCIGSLIKNLGGGIVPTGGYIVGKKNYVQQVAYRHTSPSIGAEIGSYEQGYRNFYQGLFLAPHVVAQALKTATLFCCALDSLGYQVKPLPNENFYDIVCSAKFGDKDKLIKFCQSIQYCSPVDSYVTPEPWDMPGYTNQVIMSAGCFVQGASIELSCDAPIKPPYIAYLQGGLTLEHGILALESVLSQLID